MQRLSLVTQSFLHALGAVLYIGLFDFMVMNHGFVFDNLGPFFVLFALTFSVAFMALIFFLTPVLLYLGGQKKEAVHFFINTLLFFLILGVAFLIFRQFATTPNYYGYW